MSDIQNNKDRFLAICKEHIQRDGIEKLLAWLEKSDFFTAPASRNNHLAHAGGLLEHSLNVYDELRRLCGTYACFATISEESIAIMALFHDLCKVNFYKPDTRNVKRDGVWVAVPSYSIEEKFPFGGHGSKSLYIANSFISLTADEAVAINCHMASWDGNKDVGNAFRSCPAAWLLHVADEAATFLVENEEA
ncbi:MAG: HD domain-containing protein [Clostridia bacterium]|nr:HD domain-containing protein [Clostridia bacterium]